MQVHHDEGVANRIDPESCRCPRGHREALTGERAGQPLSRVGLAPTGKRRLVTATPVSRRWNRRSICRLRHPPRPPHRVQRRGYSVAASTNQ